jgi:hypothetical protein
VGALSIQYPASEIYFFRPLNERVTVSQEPFGLVQESILVGTQQAQETLRGNESVTVKGALAYQACNNRNASTRSPFPCHGR